MAIRWITVYTEDNHKFEVSLLSQSPYTLLIKNHNDSVEWYKKSPTNSIESILEHLIIGVGPKASDTMRVYQWYKSEGLFKVEWKMATKFTRDVPPWRVVDVKRTKIASDLKAFEVLYA